MINAHIWKNLPPHLNYVYSLPTVIKILWDKYLHFLGYMYIYLIIKYRVFEQASHIKQAKWSLWLSSHGELEATFAPIM